MYRGGLVIVRCNSGPSVRHADDGALPTVPSLLVDTVDCENQDRLAKTLRGQRRLPRRW
ncbi:hypothetical protein Esi_0009_0136 [Ectocarpus siliculosus]|uniref:Uncharacterized protein n=1 Tax=Ectocarpus siliculosus TaxID=2880 RepID=D8LTS3_ECTSI|nr:hypothetical protein Esi_0009_0136 [Ectocarpus siliculosus]|eukprot:CBN73970.1 hypothetical protein Esi_0009_0136 [Ectocarpus siliculosus]